MQKPQQAEVGATLSTNTHSAICTSHIYTLSNVIYGYACPHRVKSY